MADNTVLNVGAGGDTIRSDDIAGIKTQVVKLGLGADGVDDGLVSTTNPIPVTTGTELIDTTEWIQQVAFGLIANHSVWSLRAHNPAVQLTDSLVWESASDLEDALLTSADTVFLASTDATDTAVGSGARTVYVEGVDTAGDTQVEVVSLNGNTPVETTLTWTGINRMTVITAGTDQKNNGTIWCGDGVFTLGVPVSKYHLIGPNDGTSHSATYTIPNGKQLFIHSGFSMGGSPTDPLHVSVISYDGVLRRVMAPLVMTGYANARIPSGVAFPAKSMIQVKARSSVAPQPHSQWWSFILQDTP